MTDETKLLPWESPLIKFTECEHKKNNEIAPECIHCNMAWCIERIKVLESRPKDVQSLGEMDVDKLANFIRSFDGEHKKGAGEIAEAICKTFGTKKGKGIKFPEKKEYDIGMGLSYDVGWNDAIDACRKPLEEAAPREVSDIPSAVDLLRIIQDHSYTEIVPSFDQQKFIGNTVRYIPVTKWGDLSIAIHKAIRERLQK